MPGFWKLKEISTVSLLLRVVLIWGMRESAVRSTPDQPSPLNLYVSTKRKIEVRPEIVIEDAHIMSELNLNRRRMVLRAHGPEEL